MNAAMCPAFLAALVSAGVWLKARQARCVVGVINRCIATTLADIDMDRLDAAMNEHLGGLYDES
jgi:hypothetical protein